MKILLHIIFWLLPFSIETFMYYSHDYWAEWDLPEALTYNTIIYIPKVLATYGLIYWLAPSLFFKKGKILLATTLTLIYLLAALILYRIVINYVAWPVVLDRFPGFNPFDPKLSSFSFLKLITPMALLLALDAMLQRYHYQEKAALLEMEKQQTEKQLRQVIEKKKATLEDHPHRIQALDSIFISINKAKVRVPLEEIVFIESQKEYITLTLTSGKTLKTKLSLSKIESRLPDNFIRVHRSFIIAKDKITAFSANQVQLREQQIPIGRSYQKKIKQVLSWMNQ